jgi:tetratricopeptide (TPR) repeat protein
LSIPITMHRKSLGEGQRFFPYFYFFLFSFLLFGFLLSGAAKAQGTGGEKLSPFDRLAEEATLLNKRGQADQVISLLEPSRNDKKNDSALFFNELGVAYRQKGKLSEAVGAYRAALARDPENPVIMKNLGDAHLLKKEYPPAVEQYEKALQSNPRFHQAHASLGIAYYQMEKYSQALEEFEIVLNLDPQNEQAKKYKEAILKKKNSSK